MSKRILMVDDDHGPFDYYVEALTMRGHQVEQIDDTDACLRRLECWQGPPPDIVVMDIMMPVVSDKLDPHGANWGLRTGILLLRKVLDLWPDIPLMVLTNQDDREALEQVPPGIPLLHKFATSPFRLEELIIARLAEKNPDARPAAGS